MTDNDINVAGIEKAGKINLVIGLGNPDDKYQATRHNIGENLIKQLINEESLANPTLISDTDTLVTGTAESLRYGITSTYMNDSGIAVGKVAAFLKINPKNLLIVHDEVDLDVGVARFKFGGGLAGHNGLKDIKQHLKTDEFWRLRIGVGKPIFSDDHPQLAGKVNKERVKDFVLENPNKDEQEKLANSFKVIIEHWHLVKAGQMDQAIKAIHSNC